MALKFINERDFNQEFIFNATRSSGPGGQHVNKVSTRIELRFDVLASHLLQETEKDVIMITLASRITKAGMLILVSQSERSQYDNKTKVIEKFYRLLEKALTPVKKRKPTHPTTASKTKRLDAKRIMSEKKKFRKITDKLIQE
jgi:ribosome-associated protein